LLDVLYKKTMLKSILYTLTILYLNTSFVCLTLYK